MTIPQKPLRRFSTQQFKSMISKSLKEGSLKGGAVQNVFKGSHAAKRAMSKSIMSVRDAKTVFKALHKEGLMKGSAQSADAAYKMAVRTGREKGVFEHKKTLHELAIEERVAKRKEKMKRDQRREENMERYEAEKRAEETGETIQQGGDSIVRMKAHGVAAKADTAAKHHKVGTY